MTNASTDFHYDDYGNALALSRDGTVLAVGAVGMSTMGTSSDKAGRVIVYKYDGSTWNPLGSWLHQEVGVSGNCGYLQNTEANFGQSVALSADGSRVVIGSSGTDHASPNHWDTSCKQDGSFHVFDWNGTSWNRVGAMFAIALPASLAREIQHAFL